MIFSHLGQSVRDLEGTKRFYVEVLGFTEVFAMDASSPQTATLMRMPEPLTVNVVYLRRDDFVLELLCFSEPAPLAPRERSFLEPGLTHLSFGVDDLDATCALVTEYGGTVLEDSRLPNAIFVADPEGQVFELLAGHGFAERLRPA